MFICMFVICRELDNIARQVIFDRGFGSPGNEYQYFKHRLGHGIGLQGHEEPYMVRFNDMVLEPGMTFSVVSACQRNQLVPVKLSD